MRVAVLIPTYNRESFITTCLQSIIAQTYQDLEIIVYDDGSTDGTKEIVNAIGDDRIKLTSNLVNNGIVYARNQLLALARESGVKYACWMDSDDTSAPTRVQEQVDYLSSHEIPIVYSRWGLLNNGSVMPADDICNASAMFEVGKAPAFREIRREPTPTTLGGEDVDWRHQFCQQYGDPVVLESALYWVKRHNNRISRWRWNPKANPDWYRRMNERVKGS